MNPTTLLITVGGLMAVAVIAIIVVPRVKKANAKRKQIAQQNAALVDDYVRVMDGDWMREAEERSFVETFHLDDEPSK
ncbi:hypothetical protein A2473_00065 [candidate division WWE3 bacterium RIFOXYC2_FULL_42_13]|uniref:Uncharacterized protein n=1 Tax=candidate division WWE3 bacterium TaxID=2053526 RepID=A0A3D0ZNY9_UNCKA|nr:MAG: hypothetical protein A2245_02310 [candidate division WWE3 bacterium RIFOXYA2_FULL_43_12]OGC73824.1 MAG: hypothetical protein A2337_03430 [candidate division WWE3 bacterium RIFOXYB2_FULL_43_9]OGC74039.1 MAG: hypothetical protein A2473_00065 [candidate division WWE3 bacterium RIFOXYC2_FULL_42_13]OGC75616.1 MAG: hypothetical protein A2547_00825 [candidate division WWE3 bacterium RIFOXYD2_FULL_43_10]HBY09710.1 hypothetical protein [candidate division WWE3 bacterium]